MSTEGSHASSALPESVGRSTDSDSVTSTSATFEDAYSRALESLKAAFQRSGASLDRVELYRAIRRFNLDAESAARLDSVAERSGYIAGTIEPAIDEDALDEQHGGDAPDADLLNALYADVKRVPLLQHGDQMQLLRTIRAGRSAAAALASDCYTKTERERLSRIESDGTIAMERFVTSNMRLVIRVAREMQRDGLELIDAIQEGANGLLRAIELFDDSKGLHFSTYAYHWIRQRIDRGYANLGSTIRLPVHAYQVSNQALRARSLLYNRFGREPTLHEIAEHINQKPEFVSVLWHARFISSLDAPLGESDDSITLADVLPTPTNPVEDEAEANDLHSTLDSLLGTLTPRESDIIKRRIGYNLTRPETLEEIGTTYNVTRERIRQIEGKALRKLRKRAIGSELLKEFQQ